MDCGILSLNNVDVFRDSQDQRVKKVNNLNNKGYIHMLKIENFLSLNRKKYGVFEEHRFYRGIFGII